MHFIGLSCLYDLVLKADPVLMDRLNNRPRKCLGFKTPLQILLGLNRKLHLRLESAFINESI